MNDDEQVRTQEEIDADIELKRVRAELLRAKVEEARANTREAIADATHSECVAESNLIKIAREKEEEERRTAADVYNHRYLLLGPVTQSSVERTIAELTLWGRLCPKCDIEIVFNGPGGEVISGMYLFDFIRGLSDKGHHITTVAMGFAASMDGILLQAGDTRKMGRGASLLIHEVSFTAGGSIGEVEDTVKWVKKVQEHVLDIFAERSTLTKATIKRRWTRTDWWLNAKESLEAGFCDELI
jgi:ATP-dependent protease ClpP protease subunit